MYSERENQDWLDYSHPAHPCTGPIVRFLGGNMIVGQLIEGSVPEYVRKKEVLLERFRIELVKEASDEN